LNNQIKNLISLVRITGDIFLWVECFFHKNYYQNFGSYCIYLLFLLLPHFFWRKRNVAQRKHVRVFRPEKHGARFLCNKPLACIALWAMVSLKGSVSSA